MMEIDLCTPISVCKCLSSAPPPLPWVPTTALYILNLANMILFCDELQLKHPGIKHRMESYLDKVQKKCSATKRTWLLMEGCHVAPPDMEKVLKNNKKKTLHLHSSIKETLSPHFSRGIFRIGQKLPGGHKRKKLKPEYYMLKHGDNDSPLSH